MKSMETSLPLTLTEHQGKSVRCICMPKATVSKVPNRYLTQEPKISPTVKSPREQAKTDPTNPVYGPFQTSLLPSASTFSVTFSAIVFSEDLDGAFYPLALLAISFAVSMSMSEFGITTMLLAFNEII